MPKCQCLKKENIGQLTLTCINTAKMTVIKTALKEINKIHKNLKKEETDTAAKQAIDMPGMTTTKLP